MSTKIVYLAHTQQRILDDVLFSMLNLINGGLTNLDCEVIVGTDQPNNFNELPVTVWPVSSSEIEQWKGAVNFIHRTKAVFLGLVADKYPEDHILYFDADTAIKVPLQVLLEKLDSGTVLMHASESTIRDAEMPVYRPIKRAIVSGNLDLPGLINSEMFNAGVIGVPRSLTSVFEDVVTGVDQVYPQLKVHIIEQMLFSYYLGKKSEVCATANDIIHWWGKGLNTGPLISEFLKDHRTTSLNKKAQLAAQLVTQIESTPMNPKLSFGKKLKRSLRKRFS